MRRGYILLLIVAMLSVGGCGTFRQSHKQSVSEESRYAMIINNLVTQPTPNELTASLSVNIQGNKINGQIRMRRGSCIQISATMLGLMEVARVEFFPEMVVVMDRFHNNYAVCHYADIPYRNELGLDFEVVQALFWNRIFSPGSSSQSDAANRLVVERTDENGNYYISDAEYGYKFISDGKRLNSVRKSGKGFHLNMNYGDYSKPKADGWSYPQELDCELGLPSSTLHVTVKYSSISVTDGNWPDRTKISSRMKQVTLNDILNNLDL